MEDLEENHTQLLIFAIAYHDSVLKNFPENDDRRLQLEKIIAKGLKIQKSLAATKDSNTNH